MPFLSVNQPGSGDYGRFTLSNLRELVKTLEELDGDFEIALASEPTNPGEHESVDTIHAFYDGDDTLYLTVETA